MTRATVDAPSLSYAMASAVAPEGVAIESSAGPTAVGQLPLVIVSTSAPVSVDNDPRYTSAEFTISVRCYSPNRVEAAQLADTMFAGFHRLWRSGVVTEYGWISRITKPSQQPTPVESDLEADDVYRFDCVLNVIARH